MNNSFTVIIETPKGSAQKYDYDKKFKGFALKKVFPAGMVFPYDFGFIPNTKAADGDPIDVIMLSEFESFPGCIMDCRIIGSIRAKQQDGKKMIENDRFIAVPNATLVYCETDDVNDLPKQFISELENFFVNYNKLEGRKFEPIKVLDKKPALKLLKAMM